MPSLKKIKCGGLQKSTYTIHKCTPYGIVLMKKINKWQAHTHIWLQMAFILKSGLILLLNPSWSHY